MPSSTRSLSPRAGLLAFDLMTARHPDIHLLDEECCDIIVNIYYRMVWSQLEPANGSTDEASWDDPVRVSRDVKALELVDPLIRANKESGERKNFLHNRLRADLKDLATYEIDIANTPAWRRTWLRKRNDATNIPKLYRLLKEYLDARQLFQLYGRSILLFLGKVAPSDSDKITVYSAMALAFSASVPMLPSASTTIQDALHHNLNQLLTFEAPGFLGIRKVHGKHPSQEAAEKLRLWHGPGWYRLLEREPGNECESKSLLQLAAQREAVLRSATTDGVDPEVSWRQILGAERRMENPFGSLEEEEEEEEEELDSGSCEGEHDAFAVHQTIWDIDGTIWRSSEYATYDELFRDMYREIACLVGAKDSHDGRAPLVLAKFCNDLAAVLA
jgi:hypothetical protein